MRLHSKSTCSKLSKVAYRVCVLAGAGDRETHALQKKCLVKKNMHGVVNAVSVRSFAKIYMFQHVLYIGVNLGPNIFQASCLDLHSKMILLK